MQKIYKVVEKNTPEMELDLNLYKNRWKSLHEHIDPLWYKVHSRISGVDNENYVPEDLHYGIIEPILNDYSFATAYADKNFYNKYYSDTSIFPETLLRNIHGLFYSSDYEHIQDIENINKIMDFEPKIIIKPSIDAWGGKMVQVFNLINGDYYNNKAEKLTPN
jgi:hypothetical protein